MAEPYLLKSTFSTSWLVVRNCGNRTVQTCPDPGGVQHLKFQTAAIPVLVEDIPLLHREQDLFRRYIII